MTIQPSHQSKGISLRQRRFGKGTWRTSLGHRANLKSLLADSCKSPPGGARIWACYWNVQHEMNHQSQVKLKMQISYPKKCSRNNTGFGTRETRVQVPHQLYASYMTWTNYLNIFSLCFLIWKHRCGRRDYLATKSWGSPSIVKRCCWKVLSCQRLITFSRPSASKWDHVTSPRL